MTINNQQIYIINAKRSAIAKYGGSLSSLPITEVGAQVMKEIVRPLGSKKNKIDKVILGNVLSAGLGQNPARITAIQAGFSEKIPSFTINQVCASGLQSVISAALAIKANESDLVLAGGIENMSRCPYLLANYRFGAKFGDQKIIDGMIYDGIWCGLQDQHMGLIAENLVKKFKIRRKEQDDYALESHKKALRAIDKNKFNQEIVPIIIRDRKEIFVFSEDEQPRRDTSIEKLGKLSPAFKIDGTITAGNASTLNDAAAICLIASDKFVKTSKFKPLALIRSYASVGVSPKYFGLGAYEAIMQCLKKINLSSKDIDLWEINEAFACQMIAVLKLLKIDPNIVNVNGGAIALGHPIGASGARILTTLIYELQRRKLKYGMAALCVGGGQGVAILIENV